MTAQQRQKLDRKLDVADPCHGGRAPARHIGKGDLFGAQTEMREQHQAQRPFDMQRPAGGVCGGGLEADAVGVHRHDKRQSQNDRHQGAGADQPVSQALVHGRNHTVARGLRQPVCRCFRAP